VNARLERARHLLLGTPARGLGWLVVPTGLSIAIDLALRPGALAAYELLGKGIYLSSIALSACFWALPLWGVARLSTAAPGRARTAGLAALVGLWLLPFVTMGFAGQLVYHRVFGSFMGRETLRLGIALRGTVRDWLAAWSGPWLLGGLAVVGVALTAGAVLAARRAAPAVSTRPPPLVVAAFVIALGCLWFDGVDSSYLQRATPDLCFAHGVVHAARMAVTGQWARRQGVSMRTPKPVPPLVSSRPRPPDVVLVLTESVRADATCSDPPPRCVSELLDPVAGDRVPLGKLTTQTPNTFSASVLLWTGLPPTMDFAVAHEAPVLWELARAAGYRTAYVTSQNPDYEDFGVFTRRAGIDVLVNGNDLGGIAQEQLGAPDENAIEAALGFLRSVPENQPYFLVLHLSNTHSPYRVDPALLPYQPQSADPLGDVKAFKNRYLDGVRLQERMLAGFLKEVRARPSWSDTAVVFLSDHGEQFREHGGLYHNHTLYDEEVRIPGWIAAGEHVLDPLQKLALGSYRKRRTYTQDIHETVLDLMGLGDARADLPAAALKTGRSLLRSPGSEPMALLATSTAVWRPDEVLYGVMHGERLLFGPPKGAWRCFDIARDPMQRAPKGADACKDLLDVARREFGDRASPE
jgi:hypothetical protein